jgi:hypothetical protein
MGRTSIMGGGNDKYEKGLVSLKYKSLFLRQNLNQHGRN